MRRGVTSAYAHAVAVAFPVMVDVMNLCPWQSAELALHNASSRRAALHASGNEPMRTSYIARAFACLSLLLLIAAQSAFAQTRRSDVAAVAAAIESFHAALASGNAEAATKLLAPDAVILEAGAKETRAEYLDHHLQEDIKFAKAVPSTRGKPTITIAGDVAWASSTSVTQGTYQSQPLNLVGAELLVLSRTPTGWRIRAIHWSSRKGK